MKFKVKKQNIPVDNNVEKDIAVTKKETYRFNLSMPIKSKEYLDEAAWRSRKTITEYICNLIQNEMGKPIQQAEFKKNTRQPNKLPIHRLSLNLSINYKDFLETAAWLKHKSVTEYLNDLINIDFNSN